MEKNKLTIKVPGKLMVAGEFSVLVPYQHLVVTAVDRFVYAEIEQTDENKLSLEDFELHKLAWSNIEGKVHIETNDPRVSFVQKAMQVSCKYLKEQGTEMEPFHLSIRSELDDTSGIKYGLGSSAAVVSAVVNAILAHTFKEEPPKKLVFKLASLAHVLVQGSGSGADIAASVYGGILEYASFQAEWLLEEVGKNDSIKEIVEKEWKYLSIRQVDLPSSVRFCVGWTGKPASTVKLVDRILKLKETDLESYETFLKQSEEAVQELLEGMRTNNPGRLFKGVQANRKALKEVGERAHTSIETPLLAKLSNLADEHGGAGKLSGAGGGDCGIAFMPASTKVDDLFKAWGQAGIKPLHIKSCLHGAILL